jgi:hypothetical protein
LNRVEEEKGESRSKEKVVNLPEEKREQQDDDKMTNLEGCESKIRPSKMQRSGP